MVREPPLLIPQWFGTWGSRTSGSGGNPEREKSMIAPSPALAGPRRPAGSLSGDQQPRWMASALTMAAHS